MKNAMDVIFYEIRSDLESRNDRSAYQKGVTLYALELLKNLRDRSKYEGRLSASAPECEAWMLNGADSWSAYSWGGSSLCDDGEIAKRLCCPSELKKTRNGQRRLNSREEWRDVQARALSQACSRVLRFYAVHLSHVISELV